MPPADAADAPTIPAFTGFTRDAIEFMAELAINNDRAWFQPRKADYERLVRDPMRALVTALADRFRARDIPLVADPDRSVSRIYRDTRFSKDKSPYKDRAYARLGWAGPGGGVGGYIGFQPGTSTVSDTDFVGLEKAPFVAGRLGHEYKLKADDLGSLAVGSPVYYRRLPVGQVTSFDLASDGKSVEMQVFVNAPYDGFVKRGTRFWRVSGIEVSLDANGFARRDIVPARQEKFHFAVAIFER